MSKVTLYIATHNKTGLMYFGKTTRWFTENDLQLNYHGSGVYWLNHLKTHGDDVTMRIYKICELQDVTNSAIDFSIQHNIVESKEWANLKIEDGLDGGSISGILHPCHGTNISEEHKQKISDANKDIPKSKEHRQKLSKSRKGKSHPEDTKMKISKSNSGEKNGFYGKSHSDETKLKISSSMKGKENIYKGTKEEIIICPHCNKNGGLRAMKRWHFDNCRSQL